MLNLNQNYIILLKQMHLRYARFFFNILLISIVRHIKIFKVIDIVCSLHCLTHLSYAFHGNFLSFVVFV